MEESKKELYGYLICNAVLVDITHRKLVRLISDKSVDDKSVIHLRETMMRLLLYILSVAPDRIISDDEILFNVWDNYKLSSSSQRLWQVMQSLQEKMMLLGVQEDFIIKIKAKGFYVNKNLVTPLYYQK